MTISDAFLNPFFVVKQPIFKASGDFRESKRATGSSKHAETLVLAFHVVQDHFTKKNHFFPPGGPGSRILASTNLGYVLQLAATLWA